MVVSACFSNIVIAPKGVVSPLSAGKRGGDASFKLHRHSFVLILEYPSPRPATFTQLTRLVHLAILTIAGSGVAE